MALRPSTNARPRPATQGADFEEGAGWYGLRSRLLSGLELGLRERRSETGLGRPPESWSWRRTRVPCAEQ